MNTPSNLRAVKTLNMLDILINRKVDLYDARGYKVPFVSYMYNRLFDIYHDLDNDNLFYNPIDLMD